MQKLFTLRNKIDRVDQKLQKLLNKRAYLACKIGKYKRKHGIATIQPERETEIMHAILCLNKGPLSDQDLIKIYKSILSVCQKIQV